MLIQALKKHSYHNRNISVGQCYEAEPGLAMALILTGLATDQLGIVGCPAGEPGPQGESGISEPPKRKRGRPKKPDSEKRIYKRRDMVPQE